MPFLSNERTYKVSLYIYIYLKVFCIMYTYKISKRKIEKLLKSMCPKITNWPLQIVAFNSDNYRFFSSISTFIHLYIWFNKIFCDFSVKNLEAARETNRQRENGERKGGDDKHAADRFRESVQVRLILLQSFCTKNLEEFIPIDNNMYCKSAWYFHVIRCLFSIPFNSIVCYENSI